MDHVVARCLLEKPYPPNLKTVPSCRPCNEAYARDEEYFLAIMAQSGFAPSIQEKVSEGGVVDRMLQRSVGLDTQLQNLMNVAEDGRVYIDPDETRIGNVAQKVAFGLFVHRYKPLTTPNLKDLFVLRPIHDRDPKNFIVTMAHDVRFRRRRWSHMQTIKVSGKKVQVLDYMFIRNWVYADFGRLFCLIRFHETIWAAVRCPNPTTKKHRNGRLVVNSAMQSSLFGS